MRQLVGTGGTPVHLLGDGVSSGRSAPGAGADAHLYAGSPDNWVDPSEPAACAATTKKGDPCKARPTSSGLCVGHARSAAKVGV